MNMFGRVLILALFVLGANSAKHAANKHAYKAPVIVAIDSTLSAEESSCVTTYNNAVTTINTQLTSQTNACYSTGTSAGTSSQTQSNPEITTARNDYTSFNQVLSNCAAITDDYSFVVCIQNQYDVGQQLLKSAYNAARSAQNQMSQNQNSVEQTAQNCVQNAMQSAKNEIQSAENVYNQCLSNAMNQAQNQ